MRIKKRQIEAVLLASCMTICTVMANAAISQACNNAKVKPEIGNASKGKLMKQIKKKETTQYSAQNAYKELLALLDTNEDVKKVYAGAYINNNNVLVVQLTTSSQEIKDVVQQSTVSQKVEFGQKKYSYDELKKTYDKIYAAMQKSKESTKYVSEFSIDEANNVVLVALRDLSYKDKFLTEICNDSCIQFEKYAVEIVASKDSTKVGKVYNVKNIRYTVTKKTETVREVTVKNIKKKSNKSVTIPATVTIAKQKYKVVGIEKNAFKGMKKLKTVIIGKNVKNIGNKAFMNCKKLTNVKILSKNCSFSGKSIWKGTSKKLVVKVEKNTLKKMKKKIKKSGLNKSAVKAFS